jgi:hypothetical protein
MHLTSLLEKLIVPEPYMSAKEIVAELQQLYKQESIKENPILAHDQKRQLWQLRALQQLPSECKWNQPYNLLHAGHLFSSPKNSLGTWYNRLVDKELFEKYADTISEKYVWKRNVAVAEQKTGLKMKALAISEKFLTDFKDQLPPVDEKLLSAICHQFNYYDTPCLSTTVCNRTEKVLEVIQKAEKVTSKDARELDRAITFPTFAQGEALLKHLVRLNSATSGLLCAPVGFSAGKTEHAVVLVVHKYLGDLSYFLIDSSNNNMLTGMYPEQYAKAIDLFKKYIQNPEAFKKTLVRFIAAFYYRLIARGHVNKWSPQIVINMVIQSIPPAIKSLVSAGLHTLDIWQGTGEYQDAGYKKYLLKGLHELGNKVSTKEQQQKSALSTLIQMVKDS